MITVKDIEKIINDASKMKLEVTVRDISYVLLFFDYSVKDIAYKSIFDKDADSDTIEKYDKSKKVQFLKTYISSNYQKEEVEKKKRNKFKKESDIDVDSLAADITFEENKAKLILMLQKVNDLVKEGEMSAKDGVKAEIEIRSKLNDKFKVSDEGGQQYIIVEQKFNDICPYCSREISVPTKEDLMKKYNLIEREDE